MPNTQEELFFSVNRAKSHNTFVVGTLYKIGLTNLKQLKTFFGLKQIWHAKAATLTLILTIFFFFYSFALATVRNKLVKQGKAQLN